MKNSPGKPNENENSWREVELGQLVDAGHADIRTGPFGTQLRAQDYGSDGVPVVNVRNLGYGRVRPADLERIDLTTHSRLSVHVLAQGDLVFGRKGAVDRHILVTAQEHGWMQGSDCIRLRLRPDGPVLPEFLSSALLTPSHKAWMDARCSHGAIMASLNQDILRSIRVSVPDLHTQRRITTVLTAFDDWIEINQRRIELSEDLARSLYREWFARFRFPGYEDARFENSELGPIPVGWRVGRLCEVADVNKRTVKASELPDPFRYLDISTVHVGRLGEPRVFRAEDAPGRARRKLRDGDVVWATVRPNRRAHAVIHDPPDDLIASTGLAVLSPERVPSSYLFMYAADQPFTDYLVGRASGSAYPAVRPPDFEKAPILVPPAPVLEAFDRATEAGLRLTSSLALANRQLAATRDLLLPRLVTGRLDVADIDLDGLLTEEATAA